MPQISLVKRLFGTWMRHLSLQQERKYNHNDRNGHSDEEDGKHIHNKLSADLGVYFSCIRRQVVETKMNYAVY